MGKSSQAATVPPTTHAKLALHPPALRCGCRIWRLYGVHFPGLGPKVVTPEKLAPYECGVPPVGDARERQSVKFYLVAMVFLLFDIEVAFLYPWAMALRDLGWTGFVQVVLFLVILLAGFVYIWRKGVLDWGVKGSRDRARKLQGDGWVSNSSLKFRF